ncbi:MAG: hypothetical protein FJX68_12780 [Alphaproteobacteria bacterium]|nr:hypothetical protein [Alphaproteobacteria bacterium]
MRRVVYMAFVLALFSQPAAADFGIGQRHFLAGNFQAARQHWQPLAEAGDPAAQYALGVLFERGLGMSIDPTTAQRWFAAAARQGYRPAITAERRLAAGAAGRPSAAAQPADDKPSPGKQAENAAGDAKVRAAVDRLFAELARSGLSSYAGLSSSPAGSGHKFQLSDLRLRCAGGFELRFGDVGGEYHPPQAAGREERIGMLLPQAVAGLHADGGSLVFKAGAGQLDYARDTGLDLVTRLAIAWQDFSASDGRAGGFRASRLTFVSQLKEQQAGRWDGAIGLTVDGGWFDCGCGGELSLGQLALALDARGLQLSPYRSLLHGAALQPTAGSGRTTRPLSALAFEFRLSQLRASQTGKTDFALDMGHMRLGLEGLDQPAARLRLELGHDGLTSSDADLPLATASDLAIVLDRLPVERLAMAAMALGMQAALGGSLDVAGPALAQALGELATAGTELRLERGQISYQGAQARLEGLLQADAAAALGVLGGFNLSVHGLDALVKAYEKAANGANGLSLWMAVAPLLAGMAEPAGSEQSRDFRLELKRDGSLLLDGADLAPMLRSLLTGRHLAQR